VFEPPEQLPKPRFAPNGRGFSSFAPRSGGVTSSKAKFLAQAWKAAYQKAKTLGWLAR
jgi:hypothetical protein